ncbi:hypothetical protein [Actinoplanes sp. DH11]|uniref:hypothetical protein n=1 Tax=Actinoplanes sp. DH11 TaxID=2857011 RepID=UPI001E3B0FFD|nr:hypothetical protein [Actinoplanes sp. DH11]
MPLRHGNFNARVFNAVVKALGLPGTRFHDLRHFAASAHLLLVGEGRVGEVSKRLGHASPASRSTCTGTSSITRAAT